MGTEDVSKKTCVPACEWRSVVRYAVFVLFVVLALFTLMERAYDPPDYWHRVFTMDDLRGLNSDHRHLVVQTGDPAILMQMPRFIKRQSLRSRQSPHSLESITFLNSTNLTPANLTPELLRHLRLAAPNVTKYVFDSCPDLTDEALSTWTDYSRPSVLTFVNCPKITVEGIKSFFSGDKIELNVAGCAGVSESDLSDLLIERPDFEVLPAQSRKPTPRDVYSRNSKYVLRRSPESDFGSIFRVGQFDVPLWSFRLDRYEYQYAQNTVLSDDGQTVVEIAGPLICFGGYGPFYGSVNFRSSRGLIVSHDYRDLNPHPLQFSDYGLRQYGSVRSDGKQLHLTTTGPHGYSFDLETGKIVSRWLNFPYVLLTLIGYALMGSVLLLLYRTLRHTASSDLTLEQRVGVRFVTPFPVLSFLYTGLYLSGFPFVEINKMHYVMGLIGVLTLLAFPFCLSGLHMVKDQKSRGHVRMMLLVLLSRFATCC